MEKIELPKFLEPELLKKIRIYLLYYLFFFLILWLIIFIFSPKLLFFLIFPYLNFFKPNSLVFTGIEEVFFILLKLSFYSTLIVTLPLFLIPLRNLFLKNFKKKLNFFKKLAILSVFNLVIGLLIGYFLIFPNLLKFFLFFGKNFEPLLKIDFFVLTLLKLLLFFVLIFQFPLFLIFLIKLDFLKKETYKSKKIYFWLFFYGIALIISPTDFLVQVLLTLFFYLFFKLSFWLSKLF